MGREMKINKKIRLQGLSFREELEGEMIDFSNKVVYMSIIPWEFCNWSCRYCHEDRRVKENDELSLYEIKNLIGQAKDLGIKTLLFLGGEVLLDSTWPITKEVVYEANRNGLITLIYTNASQITEDMAKHLADNNVSVAIKIDSLNREKYDYLTQRDGSFDRVMKSIEILKKTSIGETAYENENERLVRLLFTTVGNASNIDEYVSLARFATNNNARWMMEALNHRGDVIYNPGLSVDPQKHSRAMEMAMFLNPEQHHDFSTACRLFSCITIRKKGEIAVCPQDYNYLGNIRNCNLGEAVNMIYRSINEKQWREEWAGDCPIKSKHLMTV